MGAEFDGFRDDIRDDLAFGNRHAQRDGAGRGGGEFLLQHFQFEGVVRNLFHLAIGFVARAIQHDHPFAGLQAQDPERMVSFPARQFKTVALAG